MSDSNERPAIVQLKRAQKVYQLGNVEVPALIDIDLDIYKGDFAVVAGPSGSGKTTLLNLIGCVDVSTGGQVIVDGNDTGTMSERELTKLRLHRLGFIFQSFNLVSVLDAYQNVEFPLLLLDGISAAERKERVTSMLASVGLGNHGHHRPSELSGGQRQRVAIARALVTRPQIVLADEPTANLDSKTSYQIIDLMRELNSDNGTTFIFSTHDPKVMQFAGRSIELVDGRVVRDSAVAGLDAAASSVGAPAAEAHA